MTKLDDRLEVFFIAVNAAFAPDATAVHGRSLQTTMKRVAELNAGMPGHTICTAGSCGCKRKLPGFDPKLLAASTTHVRRRECHS